MFYIVIMDIVNLAGVDLNLLIALDALLEEAHVTRAASRIGLTQSATSNALGRLRALFDDPLLVRAGARMRRTPRGEALRPAVRAALDGVRELFVAPRAFEPGEAAGTLTLSISDYVGLVLVPALVADIAKRAPGLGLRFVAHGNRVDGEGLAEGAPRLSLGFFFDPPPGVHTAPVFTERFACLVRPGDLRGRLTRKRYLAMPHVLVSQRGETRGYVDRLLEEAGATRTVRTVLPHFLAAGAVVADSGGVVTLPERVARITARRLGLEVHALPFPNVEWPLVMAWHARFEEHGETGWLRERVLAAARASG